MTDYIMLGVMCMAAIAIGLVFRGVRKYNDEQYMPDDDDPGFDVARDIAHRVHRDRSEKLTEVMEDKNPEDGLADIINSRRGPL